MVDDPVIEQALALRNQHIMPVAEALRAELPPTSTLDHPPMVLLLGNHSSGKSSLINHLVDHQVQRTGVAPVDDGFTVLMHSERERTLDGSTLVSTPGLPFTGLSGFGQGLVQHLGGRGLDADLLKHLWLIDSPGMIDSAGADAQRPYDFSAVVRWFAERADLVLLFFDPEKPGTTGETLAVLNESLSGIDHKLRIVMNKMDLFDGVRDFARTYGALCWNLSRCLKTKDMPHIFTTVIPGLVRDECSLPLEGFAAALLELEATIAELPERRRDSLISMVREESQAVLIRARVIGAIRNAVRAARIKVAIGVGLLTVAAGGGAWWAWSASGWAWPLALLATLLPVLLLAVTGWLPGVVARRCERNARRRLDYYFAKAYHDELASRERSDDLRHDWQRVRVPLLRILENVGLDSLRRVDRRRQRALQRLIDQDLPALRR